jgi:hypothetical protein
VLAETGTASERERGLPAPVMVYYHCCVRIGEEVFGIRGLETLV